MHHSIEVRVPFLDLEFVEFMLNYVDPKLNTSALNGKKLLRKAFRDSIYPPILKAPKAGFGLPINLLLRTNLKPFLLESLSQKNVENTKLLNYKEVSKVVDNFLNDKQDTSWKVWQLLVLVIWLNTRQY